VVEDGRFERLWGNWEKGGGESVGGRFGVGGGLSVREGPCEAILQSR